MTAGMHAGMGRVFLRGLLLAFAFAASAACVADGTAADGPPAVAALQAGDPFPALRGEFLSGRPGVLPAAARSRIALVALGFTYDSRKPVETWSLRFRMEFAPDTSITWYEVPVIGGAGKLAKPFIQGGMRGATPAAFHDNVLTVFGDTDPWKKRLLYRQAGRGQHDAYLVLLDRAGRVAWLHAGPWDAAAYAQLSAVTRRLRDEARPQGTAGSGS